MTDDQDTQTYVNDSATSSPTNTGLAQPRSPDVLRDLIVKRRRVGPESRKGRLLSNLIKQRPWLELDRLREVMSYDPETGHLMWIKRLSPMCKMDRPAGVIKSRGYRKIVIDGRDYTASQLAWFLYHGAPAPAGFIIDHKNLNKDDNRIENLRLATYAQNITNQTRNSQNTSGLKGVSRFNSPEHKAKFRSMIRVNGKRIFLGNFMTAEEAHEAYCKAAQKHHGEFARTE